ncbi:hypothetical protein HY484_00540 [Candidatus Woesearchaeota archaeon]|nr:hypothetical protein [Candidatus Woesearchaeota archaeon]
MQTTIQIEKKTLERLKYFKEHEKESYNEIVNKLIDEVEEGELSDFAFEGILRGIRDIKEGRTTPIQDVAKKFGIKLEE